MQKLNEQKVLTLKNVVLIHTVLYPDTLRNSARGYDCDFKTQSSETRDILRKHPNITGRDNEYVVRAQIPPYIRVGGGASEATRYNTLAKVYEQCRARNIDMNVLFRDVEADLHIQSYVSPMDKAERFTLVCVELRDVYSLLDNFYQY